MWFKRKPRVVFKPAPVIPEEPAQVIILEGPRRILGIFDNEADADNAMRHAKRQGLLVATRVVLLNRYNP